MLLNAAKCQGYSFYCFWVIKGKPTGGGDSPLPPTQIKVKDIKNLFRLRKEQNDAAAKGVRNLFRLKKKLKELKI